MKFSPLFTAIAVGVALFSQTLLAEQNETPSDTTSVYNGIAQHCAATSPTANVPACANFIGSEMSAYFNGFSKNFDFGSDYMKDRPFRAGIAKGQLARACSPMNRFDTENLLTGQALNILKEDGPGCLNEILTISNGTGVAIDRDKHNLLGQAIMCYILGDKTFCTPEPKI